MSNTKFLLLFLLLLLFLEGTHALAKVTGQKTVKICTQLPTQTNLSKNELPEATTPQGLAENVVNLFSDGTEDEFARIYPFQEGRELVKTAVKSKLTRFGGLKQVIKRKGNRAILLLSGHLGLKNSGDATSFARSFSGFYEAVNENGKWQLAGKISIDRANQILAHEIDAEITPNQGLKIKDELLLNIREKFGFAALLNHRAKISSVLLDGKKAKFAFAGGLLWVEARPKTNSRIELSYELQVENAENTPRNSGFFGEHSGHLRNQYFWHPFFGFSSANDQANFKMRARIPAKFQLVTSISQTEKTVNGFRLVNGQSTSPTFGLTLIYDDQWKRLLKKTKGAVLEVFGTQDFEPKLQALEQQFEVVYTLFRRKFGEPKSKYFGVVQTRSRPGAGWAFRTNDFIVANAQGGAMDVSTPVPRAYFAHEVAHGWTSPTGAATNLLSEGWATFAEGLFIGEKYGAEAEKAFWERQRNLYEIRFEGKADLLNDPHNAGVSYFKGGWIFKMLHHVMGEKAFEQGLRDYMSLPNNKSDLDAFINAISSAAKSDLRPFLMPWVKGSRIPEFVVRIENDKLIVTQKGEVFNFPVEIELTTSTQKIRRTVHLTQKENQIDVDGLGQINDVHIDPDRSYLLKRDKGEIVRFELNKPDAQKVELVGDFSPNQIGATKNGEVWTVELPLTEGHYVYNWKVDDKWLPTADKAVFTGIKQVRGLRSLENAYPK